MPNEPKYTALNISDLLLDEQNPRFASSVFAKEGKINEQSIVEHLIQHSNIIDLANRICAVGRLHASELIACYPTGENKYVVLEGNRRVCACKLLLDRTLVPDDYRKNFPFIHESMKNNITTIQACVYPDRESVQTYLSDRHITGARKWSALEKNNYYMSLFQQYGSIEEVKKYTNDSESVIKYAIERYQFFIDVFNVLQAKHQNISIEKLNYLPMTTRFMSLLVGSDIDVGLDLHYDDITMRYSCAEKCEHLYNDILLLVGEAFLLRKERKYCEDGELSKIVSSEVYGKDDQKLLILKNSRIPGLLEKITSYKLLVCVNKEYESSNADNNASGVNANSENSSPNNRGTNSTVDSESVNGEGQSDAVNEGVQPDNNVFAPTVKFRPKTTPREFLTFTANEASSFNINGNSDYEEKIRAIIEDLRLISVYKHPYACALLYRTLLEVCTKLVYSRHSISISKNFNEGNLSGSMLELNNNFIFNGSTATDSSKTRSAIKDCLGRFNLVNILNLYIHHPNPVDEQLLLSTWNTMKYYLIACLSK